MSLGEVMGSFLSPYWNRVKCSIMKRVSWAHLNPASLGVISRTELTAEVLQKLKDIQVYVAPCGEIQLPRHFSMEWVPADPEECRMAELSIFNSHGHKIVSLFQMQKSDPYHIHIWSPLTVTAEVTPHDNRDDITGFEEADANLAEQHIRGMVEVTIRIRCHKVSTIKKYRTMLVSDLAEYFSIIRPVQKMVASLERHMGVSIWALDHYQLVDCINQAIKREGLITVRDSVVRWTSQASGVSKTKEGLVVQNVPAGVCGRTIADMWRKKAGYSCKNMITARSTRDHDSYLVLVMGDENDSRDKIYWPKVADLEIV